MKFSEAKKLFRKLLIDLSPIAPGKFDVTEDMIATSQADGKLLTVEFGVERNLGYVAWVSSEKINKDGLDRVLEDWELRSPVWDSNSRMFATTVFFEFSKVVQGHGSGSIGPVGAIGTTGVAGPMGPDALKDPWI